MIPTTRRMKPILLSTLCAAAGALVSTALIAADTSENLIAADTSENWSEHCARCHGPDGAGKSTVGKKLKIRDLTSPEVQAQFTDEQAFDAIKNGIKNEKGDKFIMNAFGEKLSDEEITEMVAFVRSMRSK